MPISRAYRELGAFFRRLSPAMATDALKEAERLDPGRVSTLIALGLVLNTQKRYGDAKPLLARSLDLNRNRESG